MKKSSLLLTTQILLYIFIVIVSVLIFSLNYIIYIKNKSEENLMKTKFSSDLLIIYQIFRGGGKPISDPSVFFSNKLSLDSLGVSYSCKGRIIPTEVVLSKITYMSVIDPFIFSTMMNINGNFIFKVFDAYEGKTFYYDPLLNSLNFKDGLRISNEHQHFEKKVRYGSSYPIILVEPVSESNCEELKNINVFYSSNKTTEKMVPAVFYLEIYQ